MAAAAATSSSTKTPEQWKEESRSKLSSKESQVIWDKGTEASGSGEYNKYYPTGGYFACKVCETPLYSAAAKFDSGCGWPAFDKCYKGSIITHTDVSHGMKRVEIVCGTCHGHLGHVFHGEKFTSTSERHCVNSVSVKYVKEEPKAQLEQAPVG